MRFVKRKCDRTFTYSIFYCLNGTGKLETKGLVKRSAHPIDSRAKVLMLTLTGEAILKRALPLIERLDAAFFSRCNQCVLLTELEKLHCTVE